MKTLNCQFCGGAFEATRSDKKYCSSTCQNRARFGKAICIRCGAEFHKTGASVRYCSATCAKNAQWENQQPTGDYLSIRSDLVAQARFVTVKCGVCGQLVEKRVGDYNRGIKQFGQVFCGRQCAMIATGKTMILTCSECGAEFKRGMSEYNNYNKQGNYVFCSRDCQDKNVDYILRGADHYCYIDGGSPNHRGKGWKRLRRIVRDRDKDTCQHCGITEKEVGKKLDVHHINPFRNFDCHEKANDLSNLITLCPSCHHREDSKILSLERASND